MPLSEDEQRILKEIEDNLTASDPQLVAQVQETTLYRHASRNVLWSSLGLVAGLVLIVLTFTRFLWAAIIGFLVMVGCALVIERNLRKMGKAGLHSITKSIPRPPTRNAQRSDDDPGTV
jgi:ammonia channel protein AmtB